MNVPLLFSVAEEHAMKLDGDVFIDEFGQPTFEPRHWQSHTARLRKSLQGLPAHAIAIGDTAAWCWGLLSKEPTLVHVSALNGMRLHLSSTSLRRIHSSHLREQNVIAIAGMWIESRASLRVPDTRRKRRQYVEPH